MATQTHFTPHRRKIHFARLAVYCLVSLCFVFTLSNAFAEKYTVSLYNAVFGIVFFLVYHLNKHRYDRLVLVTFAVCQLFFFGHAYWIIPGKQMEDALGTMIAMIPIFVGGFRMWFFVFVNVILFHVSLFSAGYDQVFYFKIIFYLVLFLIIRVLIRTNEQYEGELVIQRDKIARDAERLKHMDELKTRFFANVSHELRTPLTLVLSPLGGILKSNELSNRNFTYLQLVRQNARRLLRRVNELLELSRLDEDRLRVHPQPTDVYTFTKRLVALHEGAANLRGIQLHYEYRAPAEQRLLLDQDKLEMIFTNLLNNALKFTPRGGEVSVIVERADGMLQISVSDTGMGIPADELDAVFERFHQAANAPHAGGSGIGLALSRKLAEAQGGSLTVESTLGRGSTFYLRLPWRETFAPAAESVEDIPAEVPPPVEAANFRPALPRVLIVEDNYDLRRYLELLLADHFQVQTAENGRVAWERLGEQAAENEGPQLIIADIMMPEMDGITLLKRLRDNDDYRGIPVIMLTAQSAAQVKIEALRIGVDDYLTKPFVAEELLARARNLLKNARSRTATQTPRTGTAPSTSAVSKADLAWLETVEARVLARIADPAFTLRDLADELFVAPRTLHHKIKTITGLTPKKYQRKIKLHEARRLIQTGQVRTVSELSAALGFESQHYFSTLYQKEFGISPRAAMRQNDSPR